MDQPSVNPTPTPNPTPKPGLISDAEKAELEQLAVQLVEALLRDLISAAVAAVKARLGKA